jgi:hypothetical protein
MVPAFASGFLQTSINRLKLSQERQFSRGGQNYILKREKAPWPLCIICALRAKNLNTESTEKAQRAQRPDIILF